VRRPSRRGHNLALVGHFLIIVKLEDHDIRVLILGMCREVAISRCIRILFKATTNRHDLPRTVLLAPLLDEVNCVRFGSIPRNFPMGDCPDSPAPPAPLSLCTRVVFHRKWNMTEVYFHCSDANRIAAAVRSLTRVMSIPLLS
jgi:hypothetical protein